MRERWMELVKKRGLLLYTSKNWGAIIIHPKYREAIIIVVVIISTVIIIIIIIIIYYSSYYCYY